MTDMPYPRYAQGLYRAIHEMSCFNVPIYITENGISDVDDKQRSAFFEEYLGVLSETCKAGYDVRGWFYWSLMDNFEWNDGFDQHFGLYEVDLATQKRTMRPSVQTLQKIIQDSMQVSMA
jgi:beta-glucosidase